MSAKIVSILFGFLLIILLTTQSISADVDDNEISGPEYRLFNGIKVYRTDPQCAMLGGLCVVKDDCAELTSKSGLCPTNSGKGVECCYEFKLSSLVIPSYPDVARCTEICVDRCPENLRIPGTDCAAGQHCCTLI